MNLSLAGFRGRIISAGRPSRAAMTAGVLIVGAAVGGPAVAAAAGTHGRTAAAPAAASTTLKLKTSTGLPDTAVGFTGGGYRARERVTLHWRSASGPTLDKVTAGKTGSIAGTFRVPLPKAGVGAKVTVVAVGGSSKREGKATFAQSCGDEWTKLSGGDWSKSSSWSTGAVPGPTTKACITLAGAKNYTVTLSALTGSATVGSLQVGAKGGKHTETFRMNASGGDMYLGLGHASTVYGRGVLLLTSAGGGNDFITGPGTLANYGLFSTSTGKGYSRYLSADIVNESGGTFRVGAGTIPVGGTYVDGGATLVNHGTIEVVKGSELFVNQASFSQPGGRIANSGLVDINSSTFTKSGGTATGNAWQFYNGSTLHDQAGTGAYTFFNDGVLSGTVPKGQTVTVVGDATTDIHLMLSGNVTNHGTIVMTSSTANGGAGNAWLFPFKGTPTLYNYGTLETFKGAAFNRYFNVNVVNETTGTMDIDSTANQLVGGDTITNDGTMSMGGGAVLDLVGTSYGKASLIEGAKATLGVVLGGAKTSVIDQLGCSAAGCQNEAITLAGTLKVTADGALTGSYYPIYSEFRPLAGTFANVVPAGDTVTYGADAAVPAAVDGVIVTP